MPPSLWLEDIFLIGLALDLVGAVILGWGLLASPAQIAANNTYGGGLGAVPTVRMARDRINARFGLTYLALGFLLQGFGYLLQTMGTLEPGTGTRATYMALMLPILAAATAVGVYAATKRHFLKRLLVKVARSHHREWNMGSAAALLSYGEALGYPVIAEDRNSKRAYARRVFGERLPEGLD